MPSSKFWRMLLLFGQGLEKEEKRWATSELIGRLSANLKPKGLEYENSCEAFRNYLPEVTCNFSLGISAKYDAITLTPAASIRHEAIERLFHTASLAPDSVQRHSVTIPWQRSLERRTPKPASFTIDRISKLERGVAFVEVFLSQWAEPFFSENSDLIKIDKGFNDNRAVLRSKVVYDWFEMLGRAIIAAKLVGRVDYEALTHEYRKHLRDHGSLTPDPVKAFDALIARLEQSP